MEYFNREVGVANNVILTYSTPSIFIDAVAYDNIEWP